MNLGSWFLAVASGCAPASAPDAPTELTPVRDAWSLSGCTVEARAVYRDESWSAPATCRGALFGDSPEQDDWLYVSLDCVYDDGSVYTAQAIYEPTGCPTATESVYVSELQTQTSVGTYTCDDHGEVVLSAEVRTEVDADGSERASSEDTTYENAYDEAGRLVGQDATEVDEDGTHTWTWTTWTYENDRLVLWDQDRDMDIDGWWSWTSRREYEWNEDGLLVGERARQSNSLGDESWDRYDNAYDTLGRRTERTWDDDEDGSIDSVYTSAWVGDGPWIESYASDSYADGVVDYSVTYAYECP